MPSPLLSIAHAERTTPPDSKSLNSADIVIHNEAGSKPPLFVIRTWPGELEKFEALAKALGSEQPIYSIAPPAFETLEAYPQNSTDWVEFLIPRIHALNYEGDFTLAGWSFGGVIALELAESLLKEGRRVQRVIMIDSRLPKHRPETKPDAHMPVRLGKFAKHLLEYSKIETRSNRLRYVAFRLDPRRKLKKDRARKDRRARERARSEESTTTRAANSRSGDSAASVVTRFSGERMSLLKRTIHVVYLKYARHETVVPITLLRTQESFKKSGGDPSLGWAPFALGRFQMDSIEGEHETLFEEKTLQGLAQQIEATLMDIAAFQAKLDSGPIQFNRAR